MKTIDEKRAVSKWFGNETNWYVLFVKTSSEERVLEHLKRKLDGEKYWTFIPTRDYMFRKKGEKTIRHVPWLTGYVFVIGINESSECVSEINSLISNDPNAYRMLSADGTPHGSSLSIKDRDFLMQLLDENFNVPTVLAIREGDVVRLLDDAFTGLLAKVEKVNHQNQTAWVTFDMFKQKIKAEVSYELTAMQKPARTKPNGMLMDVPQSEALRVGGDVVNGEAKCQTTKSRCN